MSPDADLELDLDMLASLLEAADVERERLAPPYEAHAARALQMELWRMRRGLIGAACAHAEDAIDVARPFARVAPLLDASARGGVLLSLRTFSKRADYVQLQPQHFHAAAELVRCAHG